METERGHYKMKFIRNGLNVDPSNPNAPSIKGPFEESKDAANLAADE